MGAEPHEILGIQRSASPERIRARYRELARRYHPDTNGGDPTAEWMFKQINDAHQRVREDGPSGLVEQASNTERASTARQSRNESRPKNAGRSHWQERGTPAGLDDMRDESIETIVSAMAAIAVAGATTAAAYWTGAGNAAADAIRAPEGTALLIIAATAATGTVIGMATRAARRDARADTNNDRPAK